MSKYPRIIENSLVCLKAVALFTLITFPIPNTVRAQTAESKELQTISSPRPLYDLALRLEKLYSRPITYEDPILAWSGDYEASRVGAVGFYPKQREITLPADLSPSGTPALDAASLVNALGAYNSQADGPRFQVLTSSWGIHIVPTRARDVNGRFVGIVSLLDYRIDIPASKRMPSEHFQAICDAVAKVSGTTLIPGAPWMDQYFAPNGIKPHRLVSDEERRQISFSWGCTGVTGREAIIDLLELSSTTMTWHVLCQVGGECVFNLGPLKVTVVGPDGKPELKTLAYDRCKDCPSHPK